MLCSLDQEVWDLSIHLDGVDYIIWRKQLDMMTYMNLVALTETQGYKMRDSIYCVKVEGLGLEWAELIHSKAK